MMAYHIEEKNFGIEGTIIKEELYKAINIVKSEEEAGHERNIDNMIQEDDYNSTWKDKDATDATTVNYTLDDTGFKFLNSFQDDTSDWVFNCLSIFDWLHTLLSLFTQITCIILE